MKTQTHLLTLLLIGAAVIVWQHRSSEIFAQEAKKNNGPKDVDLTIPLEHGYATFGLEFEGPRHIRLVDDETVRATRSAIYRKTQGLNASNMFLVRAANITDAIRHTGSVFIGGHPAKEPPGDAKVKDFWLVVYFGSGTGISWIVKSVQKKGKTIRLSYDDGEPSDAQAVRQHFVWVPLGPMDAGVYQLELFHAKQKEVTLMRRVSFAK